MLTRLSLRSVAGAARGILGLPSMAMGEGAVPASGLLLRHFADQAEPPAAADAAGNETQPAAEAAEGGDSAGGSLEAGAEGAELTEEVEDGLELTQEELALYTKRQQAYLGVDPEKYKHFLPKLARKELGSYADEEFQEEFEEEYELYPKVPDNVPLYNLRDVVPEMVQPRCEMLDKIMELRSKQPELSAQQIIQQLGLTMQEEELPPRPGAQPILRWETKLVMAVGVDEAHPANKKAKLRVYLRDLQREADLSEEALQYIARLCGPRYNPGKGEVLLTSEKYAFREDNRRHCMEMLVGLVEEGKAAYPKQAAQGAAAAEA